MARAKTTPAARAQAAVDVLTRRLERLTARKAQFEREARDLDPQIQAAEQRLAYAREHPDLAASETTEEGT